MTHQMISYPVGNGDTTLFSLNSGRAMVLVDFADMRDPKDPTDKRIDLSNEVITELKRANRNELDVVVFTHFDRDHICKSSEFFHLEHAAKYQGGNRVKIREIWVPAAAILEEGCEGDGRILRQEARHRLINGQGIKVFSRPNLLKSWLEEKGLSLESRLHCIADAGKYLSHDLLQTNGMAVFVHSPFATRQGNDLIDRNKDSIAMQFEFQVNGESTKVLMLSDLDHSALEWMCQVTRYHDNEENLEWDILKVPHHGSYLSIAATKNDVAERNIASNLKWLFETSGNQGALAIVSARALSDAECGQDTNPPHREALNYYQENVERFRGELLLTMEFPNKRAPTPIVIEMDGSGHKVRKVIPSGIAVIGSAVPPRAG